MAAGISTMDNENKSASGPNQSEERPKPSRRDLIAGGAAVALAAAVPRSFAASPVPISDRTEANSTLLETQHAPRRFGASAAYLSDGRIIVTGGYDQLPGTESNPRPLTSVYILEPLSGLWYPVAGLQQARAEHATVALRNGRVAVIGGIGTNALGSVEIYDPRLDTWRFGPALEHPRFGHSAVSDGDNIIVMGGQSRYIISQVEILALRNASSYF
jgi:Galactose oxidase, central domain